MAVINVVKDDPIEIILSNPQRILVNVMVQLAMAFSYNSFRLDLPTAPVNSRVSIFMNKFRAATYLCMLQPVIWRVLGVEANSLYRISITSVLLIGMELHMTLLLKAKSVILWLRLTLLATKQMIRTYGLQTFIETQWIRLHVPNVLRVFWITRTVYQVTYNLADKYWETHEHPTEIILEQTNATLLTEQSNATILTMDTAIDIGQGVLISGCETTVALLGMTSVLSAIAHYIGVAMAAYVGSDSEDDKNMGTVSAILFFILALQTGLTGLDPDKRLVRLSRNFCLLSTAILHFTHSIVNPILMNLSASQNPSPWKHGRPLSMCAFLIVFPMCFLYFLWSNHSVSTWLLAVTAFSIEVIVKVLISLLLYSLFMIDAHREVFWESLDDYVYYIKSTGNTIEFLFGIFVFCNGAWIMLFESGGTIRACMMCIHAYFNIFVQAKEGWKVFMKRRSAVNKINSLPQASEAQLETHNDVCAICYQELQSARITNCNHLFHGVCLRKWLYVQDKCPLCHEQIYTPEPDPNIENRNNAEFEQNMNEANLENLANAMQRLAPPQNGIAHQNNG